MVVVCDQTGSTKRGIRCASLGSQSSENKDLISKQISVGWRWEMVQVRLFSEQCFTWKNISAARTLWDVFNDAMAAGHLPLPNIQHLAPSCILLPVQGQTSG